MYQYNDGTEKSNVFQNQFTAYLTKAIDNYFLDKKRKVKRNKICEIYLDVDMLDQIMEMNVEPETILNFPVIEQLNNDNLIQALKQQSDRDLYIFYEKILEERSFIEIAADLGIAYATVTMAYYRMIKKIKKELTGKG